MGYYTDQLFTRPTRLFTFTSETPHSPQTRGAFEALVLIRRVDNDP